jgi:ubiquinone/menaquinone biosynthesis C-methylase UbiE
MDLDTINKDTYSEISLEFSSTRAYVWKCVKDFCNLIDDSKEKNIIEIGCGNGKNIQYINSKKKVNIIGVDNCQNFVNLCCDRKLNVINNPITKLDFKDEAFDYMLCIAVFHHVLTDQDRQIAIKEILRVMKKNSLGIITCWATEQPNNDFVFTEGVNIVPWVGKKNINKIRYYYVYSEKMFRDFFQSIKEIQIISIYNEVGNWIILFRKNYL